MKILLINPSAKNARGTNPSTIYPPIGLLYIATMVKSPSNSVKVVDMNATRKGDEFVLNLIKDELPDIVGISANIVTTKSAIDLAKKIKKETDVKKLICGGPMPTALPELFLNNNFDIVVRNEGEFTLKNIIDGKPLEKMNGVSFRIDGNIYHNPPSDLVDINSITLPDYKLLYPGLTQYRSRSRGFPVAPILTSRGCPYRCTYCNKNIFGRKYRTRNPQDVIEEIESLVRDFGVKQIDILDDNFALDLKRAEEILDLIIEKNLKIYINLQNGLCVDNLNEKFIKKMKKAGVYKVGIGIESGNSKILARIEKQINLEAIKKIIKIFRHEGIIVYGFFMLGLPGDTPETMMDTINFAIESNPHIADFSITIPFPGTELFEFVKKNGRFLIDPLMGYEDGFFSGRAFYETEVTRKDDVERFFTLAYRKFYFRGPKIIDVISTIRSANELVWTFRSACTILFT